MDFTHHIELDRPFDDVVADVKGALKEQGFGVLTEIDIRETLKAKLDVDVAPQLILGACNPKLAHRALEVDPRIAALLPCNVVVRVDGDRTVVDALDPKILAEVTANSELEPIANEARDRIIAALDAVAGT